MSERPPKGPVRRIYDLIYLLFVVGFGASFSLSISWHVFSQGRAARGEVSGSATTAECGVALAGLFAELRQKAGAELARGEDIESGWTRWEAGWRARLDGVGHRCALRRGNAERRELWLMANDLQHVAVAYTTAVRGYSERGRKPLLRLRAELDRLKLSAEGVQLNRP